MLDARKNVRRAKKFQTRQKKLDALNASAARAILAHFSKITRSVNN